MRDLLTSGNRACDALLQVVSKRDNSLRICLLAGAVRSGYAPFASQLRSGANIPHKIVPCHCLLAAIRLNYPIEIIH